MYPQIFVGIYEMLEKSLLTGSLKKILFVRFSYQNGWKELATSANSEKQIGLYTLTFSIICFKRIVGIDNLYIILLDDRKKDISQSVCM